MSKLSDKELEWFTPFVVDAIGVGRPITYGSIRRAWESAKHLGIDSDVILQVLDMMAARKQIPAVYVEGVIDAGEGDEEYAAFVRALNRRGDLE